MAFETAQDQSRNRVFGSFLQINLALCLVVNRRRDNLDAILGRPTILLHRAQSGLRIIPLHAADRHERAEGVKQVFPEVTARN